MQNQNKKIFYVLDKLEAIYHNEARPPVLAHDEPLDGLILTVLSQNTNDKNRDAAFENLKKIFPAWDNVVEAGASKLEAAIKSAGLANTKAKRIIFILKKIHDDFGEYSIKKLDEFSTEKMCEYLRAFPGVGAKTVACVVLFEFGRAAFPVDTHVSRIARRLGLVPEKFTPEEISQEFEKVVPVSRCLGGHVNMIEHGRAVCHSRKPKCSSCVLFDFCPQNFLS